jgi:hypothetical protein
MFANDNYLAFSPLAGGLHWLRMPLLSSLIWSHCCVFGLGEESAVKESETRSIPEIKWDTTLRDFQFDADKLVGQRLTVRCPPAPKGQDFAGLYGTDSYPSESPICLAALHAGQITRQGGTVTLQLNPGRTMYSGSDRQGIRSLDLPSTARSIVFIDDSVSEEANRIQLEHIPRISWETKFTASGFAYRNLIGQRFTFRCPPAPEHLKPRIVYGTDQYDFASNICIAALHAGKITKQGGICTVQIDPQVPQLVGSIRNGVETKSKRGGDRSISFVDYSPKDHSSAK